VDAPFSQHPWWWMGGKSEIRNSERVGVSCIRSYAIVPFPLPIGRGVFFVMSEKRGVEILLA
jgi:hypothetical protein